MKGNKVIKIFLIFVALLFAYPSIAFAVKLSIEPDSVNFTNLLPAGYYEKSVLVSTDSESELNLEILAYGEIKDWIYFGQNGDLKVSRLSPLNLKIGIASAPYIQNGLYSGHLRIYFENQLPQIEPVRNLFYLAVSAEIKNETVQAINVKKIYSKDSEEGLPLDFFVDIENKGNVKVKPYIEVIIDGNSQAYEDELLPMEEKEIPIKTNNCNMQAGEHTANIKVYLGKTIIRDETLPFRIAEKNSLVKRGVLIGIKNKKRAHIKDEVEFDSILENKGESPFYAKFKGAIYYNGTPVMDIKSSEYYILSNKTSVLPSYFIPDKEGIYKIKGSVFYSDTATEEKESFVDVRPESESLEAVPLQVSGFEIFIITIVSLLAINIVARAKIKKTKQKNGKYNTA